MVRRRGELQTLIHEYWVREVRHRVPVPSYVVDFAVMDPATPDTKRADARPTTTTGLQHSTSPEVSCLPTGGKPLQIVVVELNPFAPSTGGALFDWRVDSDALRRGPLTLRVHEAPVPGLDVMVDHCVAEALSGSKAGALGEDRDGSIGDLPEWYAGAPVATWGWALNAPRCTIL